MRFEIRFRESVGGGEISTPIRSAKHNSSCVTVISWLIQVWNKSHWLHESVFPTGFMFHPARRVIRLLTFRSLLVMVRIYVSLGLPFFLLFSGTWFNNLRELNNVRFKFFLHPPTIHVTFFPFVHLLSFSSIFDIH